MAPPSDGHVPARRTGAGVPQVAEVIGEMAAAIAYLETLSGRLHVDDQPGEQVGAAIPPSTLIALRRSCQRVAKHSDRALTAVNPRRAAAARDAARQVREIETLRFNSRSR